MSNGKRLDEKYCDHALGGEWKGCRECHVLPDWLLIYKIYNGELDEFVQWYDENGNIMNARDGGII